MSEASPSKPSADSTVSERVSRAPPSAVEENRTSAPDRTVVEPAIAPINSIERYRRISDTAYALYAERGYVDGYDVEDWLRAETIVDQSLLEPRAT